MLSNLKKGDKAVIKNITAKGSLKQKLTDFGFISQTEIECVKEGFFGNPKAYFLRGAVIALGREEAEKITVLK